MPGFLKKRHVREVIIMKKCGTKERIFRFFLAFVLLVASIGSFDVLQTAFAGEDQYSGGYEISELLSQFQFVTSGDVTLSASGHTIGAVAVGGTFSTQNTFGDAAIVPSYIHKIAATQGFGTGGALSGTGVSKVTTLYYGSGVDNLPSWYQYFPSFVLIQNDSYMNLASAFSGILTESKALAENSTQVSAVDNVITIDCLYETEGNFSIDYAELANGATINIKVPTLEWFCEHALVINIVNAGDNEVTLSGHSTNLVKVNGTNVSNIFKNMLSSFDGGQVNLGGFNLVWNFPDATKVTTYAMGGHVVAPLAEVTVHSNYEGGVIAASISGDAEGHFYPMSVNLQEEFVPEENVTPTVTEIPAATDTPVPTATNTPVPTDTPVPTATNTPVPTDTPVPTATNTPVPTDTPMPTDTPVPTATNTPVPTDTPVPTATNTPVPTDTPTPTPATGSITINKYRVDENGENAAFSGVTFRLYDDVSCEGTPVMEGTTDADGSLVFADLEAGDYYIIESTPEGYVENNTVYHAVIVINGQNEAEITLYENEAVITTAYYKVVNVTVTPTATNTPVPTDTPAPTDPADPTVTPSGPSTDSDSSEESKDPAATPAPTDPADPTETPAPTDPADPTETPAPTDPADPTATPAPTDPADPADPAPGMSTDSDSDSDESGLNLPEISTSSDENSQNSGTVPPATDTASDNGSNPKTGDSSNCVLWFGIMFIALSAVFAISRQKKNREEV